MADPKRGKWVMAHEPVGVELVTSALIAYPDLTQAQQFMEDRGYTVTEAKLKVYRDGLQGTKYRETFLKRREELAPILESQMADDMLENARYSTQVERFCIEKVQQLLEEGKVADPARAARDMSQIRTQAIDKRLALQGRPTEITQNRSIDELVNALVGMKVAERVDATTTAEEITEAADGD